MPVGESSGANKAGGCLEGVSPFAFTVGAWQRLATPALALRSGVVRSPHGHLAVPPTAAGIPSWTPLATKNTSGSPVDARKTRHKTPRMAKQTPLDLIQA